MFRVALIEGFGLTLALGRWFTHQRRPFWLGWVLAWGAAALWAFNSSSGM